MRRSQRGFTLLEMLLALGLLGVLMGLLGTALVGANRALLAGERYSQRLEEMRSTQNFLYRALQGALPLEIGASGGEQVMVFDGQRRQLSFAAGLHSALGGGIRLHVVETVPSGAGRAMQVRFAHLARTGGASWGQPQILLHDVRALRFSYRGRDEQGRPTDWLTQWPWPSRLPQAVRIEMTSDGPVPWFAQVVALRLELSGLQAAP
ncbi:prepilin-type N-terminal cleavage/methylation domain-containing protein [Pseudomonas sp. R1-18]|uniref:prepilin-type N-terminal cleavage/methylation domain-containing protein n=1 Tax=Pseudomonas sp. R1-18 TaxID=1632772 RepID=UPI003DA82167